jgi:hypothetical protein
MIFAICGLTVEGTGTMRAGTFSIAASAVWAWAVGKPTIPIAAHKKNATQDKNAAHKNIARRCAFPGVPPPSTGFRITPSLPFLLYVLNIFIGFLLLRRVCERLDEYRGANALIVFLQHHRPAIIPEHGSMAIFPPQCLTLRYKLISLQFLSGFISSGAPGVGRI